MRAIVRAAMAATVVLAVAGTVSPSAMAAFPGRNGRIAFDVYSTKSGRDRLASVRPDGSGLQTIVRPQKATSFGESAWSADGHRLAYERFPGATGGQIWVTHLPGGAAHMVVGPNALDPSWSPDGRWIIYSYIPRGTSHLQIWFVHPDGRGAHRLLATPGRDDSWPRFSPNGRWIAFTESAARYELAVARTDGSHVHVLRATAALNGFSGDWSPNGRWIAFASNATIGLSSIYAIQPDGSGLRRITRPGRNHFNDLFPAWSPDGGEVAFQRSPCPDATNGCPFAQVALWLIRPDSSRPHAITHNPQSEYTFPAWQPLRKRR